MIHTNFDIQQKTLLNDTFQQEHRQSEENILKNIQFYVHMSEYMSAYFILLGDYNVDEIVSFGSDEDLKGNSYLFKFHQKQWSFRSIHSTNII